MPDYRTAKSRIEQEGLGPEALKLKMEGFSDGKIATALKNLSGKNITPNIVKKYFESINATIQQNKHLELKLNGEMKKANLKIIGSWEKIDDHLQRLLDEASVIQHKIIGVDKKTGEPIIADMKDLRMWKDVLGEIAKITEIRARTIGQISTGGQKIFITNIENQFNDLKQIVLQAEEKFPGIAAYISDQLSMKGTIIKKEAEEEAEE